MTTGEQLDSISTVSNTTALQHLLNPSGIGGSGQDIYIPYDSLELDLKKDIMDIDIQKQVLDLTVQTIEIDVTVGTKELNINIESDEKGVI